MLNISITDDDGDIQYERKDEDLILSYANKNKEFLINGIGNIDELLTISAEFLIFMYETIIKNSEEDEKDYDLTDYLSEVVELVAEEVNNSEYKSTTQNDSVALKCSNPKDLANASILASALHNELKSKLPEDTKFVGLDYDEFKNQLGDEDDEENT